MLIVKWTVVLMIFASLRLFSQPAADYAIRLEVKDVGSGLLIQWPAVSAGEVLLFRKKPTETSWSGPIAQLPPSVNAFIDSNVAEGKQYEYHAQRTAGAVTSHGYAHAGKHAMPAITRGDALVLVDSSLLVGLGWYFHQFLNDLRSDGYSVRHLAVSQSLSATEVKALIKEWADAALDPQALILLGHVTPPYSGNIVPDGHSDHNGAWPADVYYADLDGTWTDNFVNNTSGSSTRTHNVPADGKFDQSTLPSDAELMVGRIDLSNLTYFNQSETELTISYLKRVHAFKTGELTMPWRALIDDHFGGFSGEAFAASGWRNFAPLIGASQTFAADYRSTLDTSAHLFSYGCGGGSYTSASGIGTSLQFSSDSLQTGFTMLFGSYFGDWDVPNNFMRSALAQGNTMMVSWSGRPHWHIQCMGVGLPIGYGARLTQNNSNLYHASYGGRFVHIALLGDPTLRMHYPPPPVLLHADSTDTFSISLSWQPANNQQVDAQLLYRTRNTDPPELIAVLHPQANSYTEQCVRDSGTYVYRVVSIDSVNAYSGSYLCPSLQAMDTVRIAVPKPVYSHLSAFATPNDGGVMFSIDAPYAWKVLWLFSGQEVPGDTVLIHPGDASPDWLPYKVVISHACGTDTIEGFVWYQPNGIDNAVEMRARLFPNPVSVGDPVQVLTHFNSFELYCFDAGGKLVKNAKCSGSATPITFDRPGVYTLLAKDLESDKYAVLKTAVN
ncbi:MAG: hypothetical protein Kow0075_01050 [Salibacteraceae bacterium]